MKTKVLKYFLYVRKSQESDERQVQSIEDQINVMKKEAIKNWYKIVWEFIESKSAKSPWRIQFNEMIKQIWAWKANWIISWKLDRLTRNPIDTGTIQFMLQKWILELIHTSDTTYDISNSWLMFSVISWMANQFIIDLSKNVKRWLSSKIEKWWYPWVAPEWYMNKLDDHTIATNWIHYKILKKMWNLMLTWNYSVIQIVDIANNQWWFKTTKRKNMWGVKLSLSWWYRIFNNIFYAWYFTRNSKIYKWNHKAMITVEEYNEVKKIIWDKWKAKKIKHEFPYWWIMNCKCCNCRITAENKIKKYKSWKSKLYTYYRCTKKNKGIKCNNIAIQENYLEEQIIDILKNIDIHDKFYKWAIVIIERESNNEEELLKERRKNLEKQMSTSNKMLKKLDDLYINGNIDDEWYNERKLTYETEKINYEDSLSKLHWKYWYNLELLKWIFKLSYESLKSFEKWDIKVKKTIFKSIGSDHSLYQKKMTLTLYPWYNIILNTNKNNKTNISKFGPLKNSITTISSDTISSQYVIWQGP